jgi:osmotically-inducible protein OsmY
MVKPLRIRPSLLLLGGLFLVGCNNQDNDRLARMARAAVAKVDAASGESGLAGLRVSLDDSNLGSRISARLRWDKTMEGAKVEAHSHGGEVELKGTVRDAVQRLKAVEIANSTIGTESVVDGMTTPAGEAEPELHATTE